jgi:DNA-binding helix-hairpin-helix protein with protein kinase domain
MSAAALYVDQKRLSLGKRIGRGGEGEVFAVGADIAAKLYTSGDPRTRREKVEAMVALGLAKKSSLVAFPMSVICQPNGSFVGFLMRLVSAHSPLHDLYSPGSRKRNFPRADFRFLVRAASNVARAVASVHAAGCVIGDINHSSILVSKNATVALIDADSFQVHIGSKTFPCLVGVPEYTPPELQGIPLETVLRTPNHDAFGLAIVIFQLLFMGRHPFIGTVRRGELPQLSDTIRDYRFVYTESRDVGMDQPPGTPVLSDFSPDIAAAFEKAFSKESAASRPTATEWISALASLETSLVQCKAEPLHYYGKSASDCPWCEMEEKVGTILFLPYFPSGAPTDRVFDPGAAAFNVDVVWAQIQSITIASPSELKPALAPFSASPSTEVIALRSKASLPWRLRFAAFVIAALTVIALPALWPVWGILALYAIFGDKVHKPIDKSGFKGRYLSAYQRWQVASDAWHKSVGITEAASTLHEVSEAVVTYRALKAEHTSLVDAYKRDRRAKQLSAYLDGFEIRNTKLKGIGPAKQAALASYGVETAADVTFERATAAPGIGEATANILTEWKRKLATRFIYQDQMNDTDRQELARISHLIEAKASALRAMILGGKTKLTALSARVSSARNSVDPTLNRLHQELEQAKCDAQYLGVELPPAPPSPTFTSIGSSAGAGAQRAAAPPTASSSGQRAAAHAPSCPRCGSMMIRRVAKRGANAGGQFWGCSRYPGCRGARNV